MSPSPPHDLVNYYAARAAEYDRVYAKPERQADIRRLRALLCSLLADRAVLEVACGTGYWTQDIARVARSLTAVDINDSVLQIAAARTREHANTTLQRADAYELSAVKGSFDAAFAGFWWSHIPKSRLPGFLHMFHARLAPGATVVFADNRYVEGSNHPVTRTDAEGNTYQLRRLEDGSTHEVLKNFPTRAEFELVLGTAGVEMKLHELEYYWCLEYRLP